MTESLVLVPFGDRFLGLTGEEFRTALERGCDLAGTTATPPLAEFGAPVVFERLAVNSEQIQAWDLPRRPRKVSDTRCKAFFAEFGDGTESVELDAIHPDLLRGLVRDAIEQHVDHAHLEALRLEEGAAREVLQELAQAGFD